MAGKKFGDKTLDAFEKVLQLLAGGMSLRRACNQVVGINRNSFCELVAIDTERQKRYNEAKTAGLHLVLGESEDDLDLLEEKLLATQTVATAEGTVVIPSIDPKICQALVQAMRIRIDHRKWVASKMLPKVYGDRIQVTDGDGKSIPTVHLSMVASTPSED